MASSVFRYLAGASSNNILMACPAALGVVYWPKTFVVCFNFFKNEPAIVKRAQRNDVVFIKFVERRPLRKVAVGQVVKPGLRLGCLSIRPKSLGRALRLGTTSRDESLEARVLNG
jgi:hypothetical protein